jgi:hypothetical protein
MHRLVCTKIQLLRRKRASLTRNEAPSNRFIDSIPLLNCFVPWEMMDPVRMVRLETAAPTARVVANRNAMVHLSYSLDPNGRKILFVWICKRLELLLLLLCSSAPECNNARPAPPVFRSVAANKRHRRIFATKKDACRILYSSILTICSARRGGVFLFGDGDLVIVLVSS